MPQNSSYTPANLQALRLSDSRTGGWTDGRPGQPSGHSKSVINSNKIETHQKGLDNIIINVHHRCSYTYCSMKSNGVHGATTGNIGKKHELLHTLGCTEHKQTIKPIND